MGLAACALAPLVAALAFVGQDNERTEVTRALATIERGTRPRSPAPGSAPSTSASSSRSPAASATWDGR
jgi:hypothetical protein